MNKRLAPLYQDVVGMERDVYFFENQLRIKSKASKCNRVTVGSTYIRKFLGY